MTSNQTDSVRIYLKEIGRIKMLTADEEISLARHIQDLLKLEQKREELQVSFGRVPMDGEWAKELGISVSQLRHQLYKGRKAKNQMVAANLRLVVSFAKKYLHRGLSFQDLIQEGSLGLIRAAEKFDPEKGYKFSTYATWWIRQACTRAVADQSRTIRLPIHVWEKLNKIKQTTKTLYQKLGRYPTHEELAEAMNMKLEQLRFIAKSGSAIDSLDRNVGKGEDTAIGEFIASADEPIEAKLVQSCLSEDVNTVLDVLTPREAEVMRLRYGFDDGNMKSLQEIGTRFKLTRERIRQIEAKAIRKLRHPKHYKLLREYLVQS